MCCWYEVFTVLLSAGAQPNASAWLMCDNPRQGSSNDCQLECDSPEDLALLTPQQKLYISPPYHVNSANGQPINQRTLGVTAVHADGSLEYNAHNLYGLTEAAATYAALKDITGKRPFMLTRSCSTCAHVLCIRIAYGESQHFSSNRAWQTDCLTSQSCNSAYTIF